MELADQAFVRRLLSRHGFSFSKSMGQNFLIDPQIAPRMADEGGAARGVGVLEIGPGIGTLTAALARRADRVAAVELDKRLLPVLKETLAEFDNVEIICGDAMKEDLAGLIASRFGGLKTAVCANLPYYITTPVLMRLLEERLPVESITVMVQKEAAERLCAAPGERQCGAVSAAVHYYSRPTLLFLVPSSSFLPAPAVDSAVIRLEVLKEPPVRPADEGLMFAVVRGAFSQRRKRAVNALSGAFGLGKQALEGAFADCGIDENARAERITLMQFCRLSDRIARLQTGL